MNTKKLLAHKDGVATLVRPLYAPGLLLEDTDLTTAVDYTRNALQLAMRSLFGCGVICGLEISGKYICERRQVQIIVSAGVALDCSGNLIHVPKDVTLLYDPKCDTMKPELWVEVCYSTCESKPGSTACSEEDSLTTVNRRSRDAYAIRVWESRPKCACACPSQDTRNPDPDPNDCCGGVTVTTTVETSCCGQEQTATTTTTTAPPASAPVGTQQQQQIPLPVCACYEDHNNGKCGCDCGGDCVLLGVLKIPSDQSEQWQADRTARRFVRPMLLGARDCYCEQCQRWDQGEFSESSYSYDLIRSDRQYVANTTESLQLVRGAQISLAEKLNVSRQSLSRINGDIETQQAEITRLERVAAGAQVPEQEKRAAEEALQQARRRITELKVLKDKADERIEAQQTELDRGEKRLVRLSIDRNISAHQQELAYIDERILQRPGGKDTVLAKQREAALEALKAETEKLSKLK
ncbi:MAG TPA: hypothetical protein PKE27_08775 [Povalibacter sp.]|uniref:hypothetical protein n=1 Tax=Povalibacter sp. TaxID=1962978 RepID=UPI002C70D9A2|nr:hypothetical protein [Povalibacter sp.]HMN44652.1 hypothetical protein [Povalibacter sp.]